MNKGILQHKLSRLKRLVWLALFYATCLGCLSATPLRQDQRPDLTGSLTKLLEHAYQLKQLGEYEASINAFNECLELSKTKGARAEEIGSLIGLAIVQWNVGDLNKSQTCLKKASDLANTQNFPEQKHQIDSFQNIFNLYQEGKAARSSENFSVAISKFGEAVGLAKQERSLDFEVKCLRQLASTYWQLNDMRHFYGLSNEALSIAQRINHQKEIGNCLNNIGLYFWKIDNYSAALTNYERALKIAREIGGKQSEADALSNMGLIYKEIGNYDSSLVFLLQALRTDELLANSLQIMADLSNLGAVYRSRGLQFGKEEDYRQATQYLEKCLGLANKYGERSTEIRVLNNLGGVFSDQGDYGKSLAQFESALDIARLAGDKEAMSMILNNMGIVQFNLGNYQESTDLYQKAIDLAQEIGGGHVLWEAYLEMGNAFKKRNQLQEAVQSYKNSISIIESIRSSLELEELKASYLGTDKRLDAYQNLIDILANAALSSIQNAYQTQAFNFLEKAKARAFLDSLEVSEVNLSQGNIKLSNQEKEIMKEISSLYTKLLMRNLTQKENDRVLAQIRINEEKSEVLKRQIRVSSPAYANLKYSEVITYEEVQKTLVQANTTFLAYSLGKEQSFGFAISKNGLKIFRAPSRKIIRQQVTEYRKTISDKDSQDFQLGHSLYEELVAPAINEKTKRIVVIPDDILNLLPFETLVVEWPRKRWLIEDCGISYVPSLSVLRELVKRKKSAHPDSPKDLLAFGDPYYGANESRPAGKSPDFFQEFYLNPSLAFFRLRYSGIEVERIASLFKRAKTRVFQREDATEDHLKAEKLVDYKILHFATHGLIDDKKPARSSVMLALDNDPAEDGFLQMREVFNLKMASDLVVLSACQTGLGQFIRGEGIEGLSRAFFYAGASSVLMSLWAVNDEATCQLMERFYRHLKSSETPMAALRKAKLELIRSRVLGHPFYWAGFVINGKTDGVIFRAGIRSWMILGTPLLAGILIVFMIAGRKRKRR